MVVGRKKATIKTGGEQTKNGPRSPLPAPCPSASLDTRRPSNNTDVPRPAAGSAHHHIAIPAPVAVADCRVSLVKSTLPPTPPVLPPRVERSTLPHPLFGWTAATAFATATRRPLVPLCRAQPRRWSSRQGRCGHGRRGGREGVSRGGVWRRQRRRRRRRRELDRLGEGRGQVGRRRDDAYAHELFHARVEDLVTRRGGRETDVPEARQGRPAGWQ